MIILKLNIKPVTTDVLNKRAMDLKRLISKKLQWHKRDYSGDIKDLVEWVKTIYDKTDNNSPIKSINTEEVPVYLDDKIELKSPPVRTKREEVENYVRELQNVIDKFEKEKAQGQNRELGILIEDLVALREKLKDLLEQYKNCDTIPIDINYTRFGYYTRDGRNHSPEIVLLMGAIGDNKRRLISTYIHEMFHAYYDLCWIEDQNNPIYKKKEGLTYIEEPLTEYAMLKFLEAFGYEDVLEVAQGVRRKQFSPGTCHYGFGGNGRKMVTNPSAIGSNAIKRRNSI